MKRTFILFIALLWIHSFAKSQDYATPPETLTIQKWTGDIIFDGKATENGWKAATDIPIKKVALGSVLNEFDNSATFKMLWGDTALYIFVDVVDDDVIPMPVSTQPWNNDGIELFIDRTSRNIVGPRENDQVQFRVNVRGDAKLPWWTNQYDAVYDPFETKTCAGVITENGYSIEIAIPLFGLWVIAGEDLTTARMSMASTIKSGHSLGVEFAVIDATDVDTRKSIMNWSNNTGTDKAYTTSEFWGRMTLQGVTTSINNDNTASISIFPNPATDVLEFNMQGVTQYEIRDLSGRLMQTGRVNSFDSKQILISDLSTGIYVLKTVDTNNKVFSTLFTKQ